MAKSSKQQPKKVKDEKKQESRAEREARECRGARARGARARREDRGRREAAAGRRLGRLRVPRRKALSVFAESSDGGVANAASLKAPGCRPTLRLAEVVFVGAADDDATAPTLAVTKKRRRRQPRWCARSSGPSVLMPCTARTWWQLRSGGQRRLRRCCHRCCAPTPSPSKWRRSDTAGCPTAVVEPIVAHARSSQCTCYQRCRRPRLRERTRR